MSSSELEQSQEIYQQPLTVSVVWNPPPNQRGRRGATVYNIHVYIHIHVYTVFIMILKDTNAHVLVVVYVSSCLYKYLFLNKGNVLQLLGNK